MPTDFYYFACTPEVTCEFIRIQGVTGSVTLDWSSRAAYCCRAAQHNFTLQANIVLVNQFLQTH